MQMRNWKIDLDPRRWAVWWIAFARSNAATDTEQKINLSGAMTGVRANTDFRPSRRAMDDIAEAKTPEMQAAGNILSVMTFAEN